MQQLCRTRRLLQLVDAIFDALGLPGQAVGHHTGSRGATTERREPHGLPGLRRVVIQIVHEHQIMREDDDLARSEEHTSELQSLMRISYAVFCLKKKNT